MPQVDRTVHCLSPFIVFKTPLDDMKASPQEGGSQISSIIDFSKSFLEVCSVFSNREITSDSVR